MVKLKMMRNVILNLRCRVHLIDKEWYYVRRVTLNLNVYVKLVLGEDLLHSEKFKDIRDKLKLEKRRFVIQLIH